MDYFFCDECHWCPKESADYTLTDETCNVRLGNLLICKKCWEKQEEKGLLETNNECAAKLFKKYYEATKDIDKAFSREFLYELTNERLNGNPSIKRKELYYALFDRNNNREAQMIQKGFEPNLSHKELERYCKATSIVEEYVEKHLQK